MKNYGLNLELELKHRKPEDWLFGAAPQKCVALIPNEERDAYLPAGELQNIGEEKMDCASRAPLNLLETKFNWLIAKHLLPPEYDKWFRDAGYVNNGKIEFSDAFVAVKSGTTREGNSLIAPLEAIRKCGLIPKSLLPQGKTFDEHHDPKRITPTMENLGEAFLEHFTINYERVAENQYEAADDIIDTGGYAWPQPINGVYPKTGNPFNHAFIFYKNPRYFVFDNYLDAVDGDFVKKLAPDYDLVDFGYRLIVGLKPIKKNEEDTAGWLKNIIMFLKEALRALFDR